MLVLMSCTLMVAAPIMMVGGILMAMREDLGLSWLLVVIVPALFARSRFIVPGWSRLPGDAGADRRGQPAPARADHRHPRGPRVRPRAARDRAVRPANDDLTVVAVRAGRWLATMFPAVMLSSTSPRRRAVVRRAPGRNGEMEVGSLTAFLAYLMQILMSVMMATFMLMMVPRSAVSADRIMEVLDTDSLRRTARRTGDRPGERGTLELRGRRAHLPGRGRAGLRRRLVRGRPGQTVAVIGSTGSGKSHPGQPGARGSSTRPPAGSGSVGSTSGPRPRVLWSALGLVPQRAFLFSGTVAANLRHGKPDATDEELWEALEIAQARDFVEAMPRGSTPRSRRAAPTSPAASGSGSRSRGR